MANFKPDYLASTLPEYLLWYISDNLPTNGGNVRSAEFGDFESIAEADTRHYSENVVVLQMLEIATAYNITQISTPQHEFF